MSELKSVDGGTILQSIGASACNCSCAAWCMCGCSGYSGVQSDSSSQFGMQQTGQNDVQQNGLGSAALP